MNSVDPQIEKRSTRPSRLALGLSAVALVAFGAYAWTLLAPKTTDLVIAYPRKAVLFAAHIGIVLEHTDILAQNGVRVRFEAPNDLTTFSEVAETADVIITGEAHGLRLVTRPQGAHIVATLGSGGRLGLVVPTDSEVHSLADLRGKRVAATPANALHRWVVDELRDAGVSDEDWELSTFDGPESAGTLAADAAAQWDPYLYRAENEGKVRVLARSDYFTSVVFGTRLTGEDRALGVAVLTATKQAFHYFNSNPRAVAQWIAGETGKPTAQLQGACFPINANFGRRGFGSLVLSPDLPSFVAALKQDNSFLVEHGFIDEPVDLTTFIDGSLMDDVDHSAMALEHVTTARSR